MGVGELDPCRRSSMNVKFNGGGVFIFPNTFADLPNGMQSCNNIWLGMEALYAATPGQSPGVARIYIYICIHLLIWRFPRMVVHPKIIQSVDHFSVEPHGVLWSPMRRTPIFPYLLIWYVKIGYPIPAKGLSSPPKRGVPNLWAGS